MALRHTRITLLLTICLAARLPLAPHIRKLARQRFRLLQRIAESGEEHHSVTSQT